MTTITHKHLKKQLDIFEQTGKMDEFLLELKYSTLLLPVNTDDNILSFPFLVFEDKKYVPVFTDIHEFEKANMDENLTLMDNEFHFYQDLLYRDVDGIMLNMGSDRFPISREFSSLIEPNYVFEIDPQVFTVKEIKKIKDSIDNAKLEEFINNPENRYDFEKLIDEIIYADLLTVLISPVDLTKNSEEGVLFLLPPTPLAIGGEGPERYVLIYTSEDEIHIPDNVDAYPYTQLVNLPELINSVLLDDLDGIIINRDSANITIPRGFLLNYMKDFRSPRHDRFDNYAFVIGGN